MQSVEANFGAEIASLCARREATVTHIPYPLNGLPRMLVPRSPAPVVAASVRHYTASQKRLSRVAKAGAEVFARVGGARLIPRALALGGPGTFLAFASEFFEEKKLAFAVHLGPLRANRKPVLHVMTPRGKSIAYIKLGINAFTSRRVRHEAEALRRLNRLDVEGLVTPTLIDAGNWEGHEYLITSPLKIDPMQAPSEGQRLAAKAALVSGFRVTEQQLANSSWWHTVTTELEALPDTKEKKRLERAASSLQGQFGGHACRIGAAHGDWSRWNMSPGQSGLLVWDWEKFSLGTPLPWDEIHFRLGVHPDGPLAALSQPESLFSRASWEERSAEDTNVLLAAYLICRGVAGLQGQETTGARSVSLATWVLPGLEEILQKLHRRGGGGNKLNVIRSRF